MNNTTEDSLKHSMDSAVKHYSSMFSLPSLKRALAATGILCIIGVGLFTFILFPSVAGLINSLLLGVSLFAVTISFDYATSNVFLANDPIYVLRRTSGLSLFCWVLWLFFIIIGVAVGSTVGLFWWIKLCLLGFAAVITLRAVVFMSTSSAGTLRLLASTLLQPLFCVVLFMVFWTRIANLAFLQLLPFLVLSPVAACASALLFLYVIDRVGRSANGLSSMSLFRAFLLNWVAGLTAPFEEFLEEMGENQDVEVDLLKFDASQPKAAVLVPHVHPGPFKNIGSSLLPSLLKRAYEQAFGCNACVPLGILGHEMDLVSQKQNQKLINHVTASAHLVTTADKATPFIRVHKDSVAASCQAFGNTAFLSFTRAPKTTEDLPQELGRIVREETRRHGLDCAVVINAHNSIDDTADTEESLDVLREVASNCLEKTVSQPSAPFQVGAATVFPKEFTLKDGMGPGGITSTVIKVAEQKTAYVVIDGNNMITGVREKILSALTSAGFDEAEVFTTDTHAVNAVILGRRGYHPVGEAMNLDLLVNYVREAAGKAEASLETCTAGCLSLVVPQVRVIGEARLKSLTTLVDRALQRAKQVAAPIFVVEGLLLVLLLAFL